MFNIHDVCPGPKSAQALLSDFPQVLSHIIAEAVKTSKEQRTRHVIWPKAAKDRNVAAARGRYKRLLGGAIWVKPNPHMQVQVQTHIYKHAHKHAHLSTQGDTETHTHTHTCKHACKHAK